MKTVKTILSALLVAIAMLLAAPTATAQQLTSKADRKLAATEFSKQLPMVLEDGISISKTVYDDKADLLTITFSLIPSKLGMTLSEAKEELNSISNAQFKEWVGEDITKLINVFGCDVQIEMAYPDNTSTKFLFRK